MLRFRLSLLVTVTLLLAAFAFGLLALWLFGRFQRQALDRLLLRDLARVQLLVEGSEVGAQFIEHSEGSRLQFVSHDGSLRLPEGVEPALPLFDAPTLIEQEGELLLVGAVPWRLPSGNEIGTIRLAVGANDLHRSQRILATSLLASGIVISLAALLVSLAVLRRALEPLNQLAEQADRLDPAYPVLTAYQGPEDEVARVAEALDRALDAIRVRQRRERDAVAEVAHEIAAPLSVVAGQLEALAAERDDPRFRAARDAANELLFTAQDLLTLARGELDFPLELTTLDLAGVARRVAAQYPGVQLEANGETEVLGSPERLAQVVRNLVRNGVQATGSPTRVQIELRQLGDRVLLHVRDDGPGLSARDQERVFERWVSGRKDHGAGVGLTVARRIVEEHGGRLTVSSQLGQGSVFTVDLPSLAAQLEPDAPPTAPAAHEA